MDTTMGDDISGKFMPQWTTYDSMIPEVALATNTDFFDYPLSQGCTCNSVTGPCPRHLEEIRYQTLNTNISAPSQFMPSFAESQVRRVYEGSDASESQIPPQQQQQQQSLHHQPSHHSFSASTSSTPLNFHNHTSNQTRPRHGKSNSRTSSGTSSLSAPSPLSSTHNAPNSTSPDHISTSSSPSSEIGQPQNPTYKHRYQPSPNLNDHESTASNTTRFKTILEAVNASGFPDFDRMVAAYYTATFEKSSLPAMSQRASRSRRLAKTLREVYESSERWPSWEARGFRESAMESARSICVDEIEKVAQHLNRNHSLGSESSASPSILHGLGITLSPTNDKDPDVPIAEDHQLLAQLTTLPEDAEAAVQDQAPHLWALFTELAGPQGLYCDRVSQAVLALLIDGRRS